MNIRRWQSYEILSAPDTITYSEADVFIRLTQIISQIIEKFYK